MADTLEIFGTEYTNVAGIKATDDNNQTKTYIRPQGTKSIASNGTGIDVTAYASVNVSVSAPSPTLQTKTATYTPSTSQQTASITADSGYDGLDEVDITVNAMPNAYWGEYTDSAGIEDDIWFYERTYPNAVGGYIDEGDMFISIGIDYETKTATPTESSQTITPTDDYTYLGGVTVNAIPSNYVGSGITQRSSSDLTASGATVTVPSGYYSAQASKAVASGTAGTPTATKGTVSNHSVSVTPSVTNTTGYITGSTINGTAVTVSASELVSGTYTVDSSGTKDVTNYASASVPSMTLPTTGSATSTGTQKAIVQAMDNRVQYINIPTGYNSSATYYEIPQLILGTKTITQNGTYIADNDDLQGYGAVTVNVSGGGTPMHVEDLPDSVTSVASSISFTGLSGEPKAFWFMLDTNISTGTPSKIAAVVYDGTDLHAQTITNTSNAQVTYDGASLSKSYSNGTLTITSSGASFVTNNIYYGAYVYGGGAIDTKDVQVGSGATSITFTGLEDEPETWSCIFKSNFSTSSGYQRTIYVGKTENGTSGFEMDSAAHNAVHWTSSYSNGSFTITSQGTNVGGYFHQPGYYQLTYAYDDGSGGNYQTKSVTYTPSTTQQTATIQADSGYDALKKVNITVNAMTSMTLPTTSSAYSSGTFKATITPTSSAQYINIPVGYNSTAQYYTISAASGGGSASIGSKTLTPSNRPTSIQFTSMSGSPKAFTLRCTAAMSRSSNSSYYYVAHIRYNGTNTYGNCWRMSNGNWTNITSGYSFSYSGTTLTITSSGSTTTSPGCFYPGEYELVYIY